MGACKIKQEYVGIGMLVVVLVAMLILMTGCSKSWTDVQTMCKESKTLGLCEEEKCLYFNSAGFSTDIRLVVTQQYYECKLTECKGGQ